MTDIPLNTYIEWTEEDRERGKCPVPAGSDVTVWFEERGVDRSDTPEDWGWGVDASAFTWDGFVFRII